MAKQVFTNGYVSIAGTVLSDHVESVTVDWTVNAVEVTAMGDGGKRRLGGLQDNKFTVNFWQDFAASNVHATIVAALQGGTPVAFKLGASGTAFSATNPSFTGTALCTSYPVIAGKVGDALSTQVAFEVDGTITAGTS